MTRKSRRIVRPLNDEEKATYQQLAQRIDREERDEIVAKARQVKSEHDALIASLEHVMQQLRAERERQGLSLADVSQRSGIDRAALCRLESGRHANPTIATLMRYARALGKELDVIVREPMAC
jgi:DNA-binding XRE family transcriptional regulator